MIRQITLKALALFLVTSLAGCTLIRYVDNDDPGPDIVEPEPRFVQALILVDLPRGAANLMPNYANYIGLVEAALAERFVTITRTAIAPMYRTQSGEPLLLYGEGDPYAPFPSLQEAMAYYVSDEGLAHLDGQTDADGENLAALGLNLDRQSIFNPFFTPPETLPYFHEAGDGFIVLYLTGRSRECAYDSSACALDQMSPADYFTAEDAENGNARWLNLANLSGLPPSKIMHISVATSEGVDYETFASQCLREAHFPANHLDVLEPSEHAYFGPLMQDLRNFGGDGTLVDLCAAFSSRAPHSAAFTAGQILRMLN